MTPELVLVLQIVAFLLMAAGLVGSIIPFMPGAVLVWLGMLVWAWADNFQHITWTILAILGGIALLGMASDVVATAITGKQAGLGWKSIGAALIGALVGGIVGSFVPVLGTLICSILGAMIGITLVEFRQRREWKPSLKAAGVYLISMLVARVIEFIVSLVMIGIFIWQAYFH
ncbi:MAG: DUF456 domain-containing protein [Armatimonadota bacterium]